MTATATSRFLALYNELDDHLRERCSAKRHESHATLIDKVASQDPSVRAMSSRLHACRALRNAIVHVSTNGEEVIATPLAAAVADYAKLVRYIKAPPSALDSIAIRTMFTVAWSDGVLEATRTMTANCYRIAPVVEGGDLVGVFTDGLFTSLFAREGHMSITRYATFDAFRSECTFVGGETLGVVLAPAALSLHDAEQIFQSRFEKQQITNAILITQTGTAREPLLGLSTAHDLPSASGKAQQRLLERFLGE